MGRRREKLSETKYGKNIVTELKPKIKAPWAPKFTVEELLPVLYLDSSVVKDAFSSRLTGHFHPLLQKPTVERTNMILTKSSPFSAVSLRTPINYMPRRRYLWAMKFIL